MRTFWSIPVGTSLGNSDEQLCLHTSAGGPSWRKYCVHIDFLWVWPWGYISETHLARNLKTLFEFYSWTCLGNCMEQLYCKTCLVDTPTEWRASKNAGMTKNNKNNKMAGTRLIQWAALVLSFLMTTTPHTPKTIKGTGLQVRPGHESAIDHPIYLLYS